MPSFLLSENLELSANKTLPTGGPAGLYFKEQIRLNFN